MTKEAYVKHIRFRTNEEFSFLRKVSSHESLRSEEFRMKGRDRSRIHPLISRGFRNAHARTQLVEYSTLSRGISFIFPGTMDFPTPTELCLAL